MPASKCTHTARYADGHCKICTLKRQKARRAADPNGQRLKYVQRLQRQGKQPTHESLKWWVKLNNITFNTPPARPKEPWEGLI